ncbi:MAG: hypothetical protein WBE94_16745 [Pseudolabrys sp.]|jgi:hypothetical protein
MTRKSIITSAQETIVAAGKSAAKRAKALAGEVANAASAATAVPAVRDKAASAQETVVAAGKTAAEGTKTLVGELAHAAATTVTAAPGAVWNKVATVIGAKKPSSRTKKKVAKKMASKKRTTLKKKANIKKASRRSKK